MRCRGNLLGKVTLYVLLGTIDAKTDTKKPYTFRIVLGDDPSIAIWETKVCKSVLDINAVSTPYRGFIRLMADLYPRMVEGLKMGV